MATAHQGVSSGLPAVIKSFIYAPQGLAFSHAEAGSFGERESGSIVFTDAFNPNFADMNRAYASDVEIDIVSMQGGWKELKNASILSRQFLIARAIMDDNDASYYFINDPTPASPTGSKTLGHAYKWEHTREKSTLQHKLSTRLSLAQKAWIDTNLTATVAGETGGASLGLDTTIDSYLVAQRTFGGYQAIQITNSAGAGLVGSLSDLTCSIESFGEKDKDDQNRYIHKKIKVMVEGVSENIVKNELLAWGTTILEDATLLVTLGDGRTLQLNNAAGTKVETQGDKQRDMKFSFQGTFSRNAFDFTNIATGALVITPVGLT